MPKRTLSTAPASCGRSRHTTWSLQRLEERTYVAPPHASPHALSLLLQTPFKFPDKDGMSDVTARTVVVRQRRNQKQSGIPINAAS